MGGTRASDAINRRWRRVVLWRQDATNIGLKLLNNFMWRENENILMSTFLWQAFIDSSLMDKIAAIFADDIFKCILIDESFVYPREFHCNSFPRDQLTIGQCWFSSWLHAEQAASHYMSQCRSMTHICGTRRRWIKFILINAWIGTCEVVILYSLLKHLSNLMLFRNFTKFQMNQKQMPSIISPLYTACYLSLQNVMLNYISEIFQRHFL